MWLQMLRAGSQTLIKRERNRGTVDPTKLTRLPVHTHMRMQCSLADLGGLQWIISGSAEDDTRLSYRTSGHPVTHDGTGGSRGI